MNKVWNDVEVLSRSGASAGKSQHFANTIPNERVERIMRENFRRLITEHERHLHY